MYRVRAAYHCVLVNGIGDLYSAMWTRHGNKIMWKCSHVKTKVFLYSMGWLDELWLQGHKAFCAESLTVTVSGRSLCLPLRNLTSSDRLPKTLQTLNALADSNRHRLIVEFRSVTVPRSREFRSMDATSSSDGRLCRAWLPSGLTFLPGSVFLRDMHVSM